MRTPTTPAAFSTLLSARPATRRLRANGARPIPGIAGVGGGVAFFFSMLGSYVTYLVDRDTSEYSGLVIFGGFIIGLIAIAPGALLAAMSAWALAWRSQRAMWVAGVVASAAGPSLLWSAVLLHSC